MWTAGTKDFLWENSVASFHLGLLFALSEKYLNEQRGDWSREHENELERNNERKKKTESRSVHPEARTGARASWAAFLQAWTRYLEMIKKRGGGF